MTKARLGKSFSLTINSTKMDFLTLIEHEIRPPIAFSNRKALLEWAQSHSMKCERVGRRSLHDVLWISGRVKREFVLNDEGLVYSQIWVRAKYKYYRKAIDFHIRTVEGTEKDISTHDADHAVARSHFVKNKDRKKRWHHAWVNLLLVESGVNRSVGAMMESMDSRIDFASDRVEFNAECLVKTFYIKTGTLVRESIGAYLEEAATNFISSYRTINDLANTLCADLILRDVAHEFDQSSSVRHTRPLFIYLQSNLVDDAQ